MPLSRPEPRHEPLVFERSGQGKVGYSLPPLDVPEAVGIPASLLREEIAGETEISEVEVARHFTRLSRLNFSIDQALYPLGSCTMKHNPRINEEMARLPTVERRADGSFTLDFDRPDSIGRLRTFLGNYGMFVRALAYISAYGNRIGEVARGAVLNANYIRAGLSGVYHLKYDAPTLHEVVFSDKKQVEQGVHNEASTIWTSASD